MFIQASCVIIFIRSNCFSLGSKYSLPVKISVGSFMHIVISDLQIPKPATLQCVGQDREVWPLWKKFSRIYALWVILVLEINLILISRLYDKIMMSSSPSVMSNLQIKSVKITTSSLFG